MTASSQTTTGVSSPFVFSYSYNPAGSLASETYPSGRTVSYGFDGAARVNALTGVLSGATTAYASGLSYASHGGMAQVTYGNSVVEKTSYSTDRQQEPAVRKSVFPVPEKPGLGLDLNEDWLRAHVAKGDVWWG